MQYKIVIFIFRFYQVQGVQSTFFLLPVSFPSLPTRRDLGLIDGYIPDLINFSNFVSGFVCVGGGRVTLCLPVPGIVLLGAICRLIPNLKYVDGLFPRPDLFQQQYFLINLKHIDGLFPRPDLFQQLCFSFWVQSSTQVFSLLSGLKVSLAGVTSYLFLIYLFQF